MTQSLTQILDQLIDVQLALLKNGRRWDDPDVTKIREVITSLKSQISDCLESMHKQLDAPGKVGE